MVIAAPATLRTTPKKRTEYEVASDVVIALTDAGFIKKDPMTIARVAKTLDMPVELLRDAYRRRLDGKVYPLTSRAVEVAVIHVPAPAARSDADWEREMAAERKRAEREGKRKQTVTPTQRANLTDHVGKRKAAKEPVEGMRVCTAPCHEGDRLILRSEFSVKDKAKGTLRAWCKSCMRVYVKSRYLSSKQMERLGTVLHFVLGEGDEHIGTICPDCRQPCSVGDEVVAPAAVLHHARCADQ